MAKTDKRVLRFFVSSALLAGSAACSKNKSESNTDNGSHEEHVNEGPVDQVPVRKEPDDKEPDDIAIDTEDTVNEGPVEDSSLSGSDAGVLPGPRPAKRPHRVNTNHIGPNGKNLNPQMTPRKVPKPVPDRTNTNRQFPHTVAPVTKDKP